MLMHSFSVTLLSLVLAAACSAGEMVINYEFSNQPHGFSSLGVFGLGGGGYWNRVESSFFASQQEFDRSSIRNSLGNLIPPGNPFVWPPSQQVPSLRSAFIEQAAVAGTAQGPGVGSLVFAGQNIVQLVNTFPGQRYDIAVFYRPITSPIGIIKLSDIASRRLPIEPTFVRPAPNNFSAAIFLDVRPIEMHIGPEGYYPFGFEIEYQTGNPFGQNMVEIAGIQISGLIPEPSTQTLAALGVFSLVALTRIGRGV